MGKEGRRCLLRRVSLARFAVRGAERRTLSLPNVNSVSTVAVCFNGVFRKSH